jgi:hypothetical protein
MAKQTVNIGTSVNDGSGDPARTAFNKLNLNNDELYNYLGDGTNLNKLGNAAFKNTGTQAGNVMEVGAFGLGGDATLYTGGPNGFENYHKSKSGFFFSNTPGVKIGIDQLPNYTAYMVSNSDGGGFFSIGSSVDSNQVCVIRGVAGNQNAPLRVYNLQHSGNTIIDSNGFIKAASPVIKLFSEKIEPNDEALEQEPFFEKVDIGHYLLKNTEAFSDDGWYIEMPKDANGNVLVAVQYQQLEDNTIEVKTFAKKFDEETGDIVPNLEKPRDIPVGRWIDIRLKALPQPEIEISKTPADFQPTNLAQAVAEALKNDTEQ